MAAKKKRKKAGKKKRAIQTKKVTRKKKRTKKAGKKTTTTKRRKKRRKVRSISIVPLGTLGEIRAKAKRTGSSVGDIIMAAMHSRRPLKIPKRDINKVVVASLLAKK
jgi:hypothetical protein